MNEQCHFFATQYASQSSFKNEWNTVMECNYIANCNASMWQPLHRAPCFVAFQWKNVSV